MTDLLAELGGRPVLDEVVADFYRRVQADPTLEPIFAPVDVAKIVSMQQEFLATALSDGGEQSGTALRAIHAGHGITPNHFSRFVEHFVRTLEDRDVDGDTIRGVAGRLGLYLDDVVGEVTEDG